MQRNLHCPTNGDPGSVWCVDIRKIVAANLQALMAPELDGDRRILIVNFDLVTP